MPTQGFWGTEEKGDLLQGKRKQKSKNEGNKGTKAILGNREQKISILIKKKKKNRFVLNFKSNLPLALKALNRIVADDILFYLYFKKEKKQYFKVSPAVVVLSTLWVNTD